MNDPIHSGGSQGSVAVVIPCYRETANILSVLAKIGDTVDMIFVVDDACPDGTGAHVRDNCSDPRVDVTVLERNLGVGGATMAGYRKALESGAEVIVKLDGDGQMDPALIPKLVRPIFAGRADYTKGNRFYNSDTVSAMPGLRLLGNLLLSFASKTSSGYWHIFDPTNGYTAIHRKVLEQLPFSRISKGFFFESDMLFRLNIARAVVVDIPMPAIYNSEESSLRISRILLPFMARHTSNLFRRIVYSYFLRDFTIASVELVIGLILVVFGTLTGAYFWHESNATGVPATTGQVILAALPFLVGSQLLISFLNFDTSNRPDRPLHLDL